MRGRRFALLLVLVIGCSLAGPALRAAAPRGLDAALLARAAERAAGLERLHALIVARDGRVLYERAFRGPGLDRLTNVKSVSKSVISALVGIAIDRGALKGPDQPIADFLADRMPKDGDARLKRITIGDLLSMQAGLERTSGANYGSWVASSDWVRHALSRPFDDDPGGAMLYSTGNSHLLSAILTKATGRSTHALAQAWLGRPLGIAIPAWQRDPQGLYFGGNNMMLSPRALLVFGELYRTDGVHDGRRVLPGKWVETSWTPRTRSRFTGHPYGYGWFMQDICGHRVYYARGYGGQYVHVAPTLGLTVVITSDRSARTRVGGYRAQLNALLADEIVPAALEADGAGCAAKQQGAE